MSRPGLALSHTWSASNPIPGQQTEIVQVFHVGPDVAEEGPIRTNSRHVHGRFRVSNRSEIIAFFLTHWHSDGPFATTSDRRQHPQATPRHSWLHCFLVEHGCGCFQMPEEGRMTRKARVYLIFVWHGGTQTSASRTRSAYRSTRDAEVRDLQYGCSTTTLGLDSYREKSLGHWRLM